MANINLISARRAERVRLTRVARGLLLGTIGAGGITVAAGAFMATQIFFAQNRVAELNQELEKLRPVIQEIDQAKAERIALQPKLITLADAQKSTKRWFGIMDGLKRAIPEQTWLTNVSVEKSGEHQQAVKINGVTANQSRVGETMSRLNLQPDFYKRVDLRFTQTTTSEDQVNVEFELAAQLNLPEPPKVDANETKTN